MCAVIFNYYSATIARKPRGFRARYVRLIN